MKAQQFPCNPEQTFCAWGVIRCVYCEQSILLVPYDVLSVLFPFSVILDSASALRADLS